MPYYDTIEEDLERAKDILQKGKMQPKECPVDATPGLRLSLIEQSGTIYATDTYAAYKLLQSFVDEIERLRTVIRRQASGA